MDLVSVIIPSYNRFSFLLNCIDSIKSQTYGNLEIIVVNDKSTDPNYYTHNWENVKIIHLHKNSKDIFGHASAGYVRNHGVALAQGKYIAFCDDDDIWFPSKVDLQIEAMKRTHCRMSSTEGIIGRGRYQAGQIYKKYNRDHYYSELKNIYKGTNMLETEFPEIWNLEFITKHNCIITSSVMLEKDLFTGFKHISNGQEDYKAWLKLLKKTNCVYVDQICFYYDLEHGYGTNH